MVPASADDTTISVARLFALVENDLDPGSFEFFDDPEVAISSLIA
jgi:hypothetical protein